MDGDGTLTDVERAEDDFFGVDPHRQGISIIDAVSQMVDTDGIGGAGSHRCLVDTVGTVRGGGVEVSWQSAKCHAPHIEVVVLGEIHFLFILQARSHDAATEQQDDGAARQ